MNNHYPTTVATIVDDYLDRLRQHLAGVAEPDREEVVREIASHIYEAYGADSEPDEIARVLAVLRRLGEPSAVVAGSASRHIARIGRKKGLPFYILGGLLFTLFGLPLGLGGVAVLIGLAAAVLSLVLAYFVTAGSFILTGVLGGFLSIVRIVNPAYIGRIEQTYHIQLMSLDFGPFAALHNTPAEGVITLVLSLLLFMAGVGMIMLGKRLLRGLGFAGGVMKQKVGGFFRRRRGTAG